MAKVELEKLFGNSEKALFCGPASWHNGVKGTLFATLHYPRHAIETRPVIFQTVSRRGVLGSWPNTGPLCAPKGDRLRSLPWRTRSHLARIRSFLLYA